MTNLIKLKIRNSLRSACLYLHEEMYRNMTLSGFPSRGRNLKGSNMIVKSISSEKEGLLSNLEEFYLYLCKFYQKKLEMGLGINKRWRSSIQNILIYAFIHKNSK